MCSKGLKADRWKRVPKSSMTLVRGVKKSCVETNETGSVVTHAEQSVGLVRVPNFDNIRKVHCRKSVAC